MLAWTEQVEILKVLGDETRLQMVSLLNQQEMCVCEFVALYEMSQPAISQHIRRLKKVELISEYRKGQWIMYTLNKESLAYHFIHSLLVQLPDLQDKIDYLKEEGLRVICEE